MARLTLTNTMGTRMPDAKWRSSCINASPWEAVAVKVLTPVSEAEIQAAMAECSDSTLIIRAFKISECVFLPTMIVLEAFYISHFMEPVVVPDQEAVDRFLPPYKPDIQLDTKNPAAFNQTVTQDQYAHFRIKRFAAMEKAIEVVEWVDDEYCEQFGRGYGLLECYRSEDAETILVTAGSIGSTARSVIDELRETGRKVGMVRIRLFRPFPKRRFIDSVKSATKIAVIDRNLSPGQGGVFWEETKSVLYQRIKDVPVFGFVLGLGGTNVSPAHIKKVFEIAEKESEAPLNPILDLEG